MMLGWENFFIKSASSINLLKTMGSLLVNVFTATGIFPSYPAIPCESCQVHVTHLDLILMVTHLPVPSLRELFQTVLHLAP